MIAPEVWIEPIPNPTLSPTTPFPTYAYAAGCKELWDDGVRESGVWPISHDGGSTVRDGYCLFTANGWFELCAKFKRGTRYYVEPGFGRDARGDITPVFQFDTH